MAQDYTTFLAISVLNEQKIISYRLLSRELKVHSDVAKKMLYDFYEKQISKKAGSVSATYLLDGAPKPIRKDEGRAVPENGDDTPMRSSPFMSSAPVQEDQDDVAVPSRLIVLAREDDLEAAKTRFEHLHSIHIYSLQPSALRNLQALSECTRIVSTKFAGEDPLVVGEQYGVILNWHVKRRTGPRTTVSGVAPPVRTPAATKAAAQSASQASHVSNKPSTKVEEDVKPVGEGSQDKISKPEAGRRQTAPQDKSAGPPVGLKREQSDLFKMFSKKPKPKTTRENTGDAAADSHGSTTPTQEPPILTIDNEGEEPTKFDSDEEPEEDDFSVTNKASKGSRSSRSTREEKLRKMMDDEDDGDDEHLEENDAAPAEMPDAPPEPTVEESSATAQTRPEPSPEPAPPTVSGGRRRGKRKVMKKVRTRDEDNMLVTTEQPVWESFSEDEPAPPRTKKQPHASTPTASSSSSSGLAKGKKGDQKGGEPASQKGIASFFGKR